MAHWPGSRSTLRVDRVLPGQFSFRVVYQPGPVLAPGQPGPGLTRRAGPGFKTMLLSLDWSLQHISTSQQIGGSSHFSNAKF